MTCKTNNWGVWILSVHDKTPEGHLAFDLLDIIKCLTSTIESYRWVAFDLDFLGDMFFAEGECLSTSELIDRSTKVEQVIDDTFLAYSHTPIAGSVRSDWSHFPGSSAVLAVVAIDSSFFDVYTKNVDHMRLLKSRFADVREEDPDRYFLRNDDIG